MGAPNTELTPIGAEKFFPPLPPTFTLRDAWSSAASLFAFATVSVYAMVASASLPWWAILPFCFTAAGSTVGFLYETWLILQGAPYQLLGTPAGRFIQKLRLGNLAPVFGSVYLAYVLLAFGQSDQAAWLVVSAGLAAGFLLVLFLCRGPVETGATVLTLGLLGQLVLVLSSSELGGWPVRVALGLAAVGLYATTLIGSETPRQSTRFHITATAVVVVLLVAFQQELSRSTAGHHTPEGVWLYLGIGLALGVFFAFRLVPSTWADFRSHLANGVWPLFYLVIAGGARFPRPRLLSQLYQGRAQELRPLRLLPYYLAHPRNLQHQVSIPALDDALTVKVQAFGFILQLVKLVFGLASAVGRVFPFANIDTPLALKPRLVPWSDGSDYWPAWLTRTIYLPRLGWFSIASGVRGPAFQPTPDRAVNCYRDGQLLAFLVEYGAAGAFIEPVVADGTVTFKLDLSFLEGYETKPDYEPYGGCACFAIDDAAKHLKLIHVRAPGSRMVVPVRPADPAFRRAEDLILASLYYYVVSGKHLVEIHMGLNLVEVALFNSFDARGEWHHPVRQALYPHLFAHELAEELTTQNLLEDRQVFSQIFATTNSSLMRHLNDRFGEYQLGRDEDFEHREAVLLTGRAPGVRLEDVLPEASLVWEKQYAALWQAYATKLIEAVFADDRAVANDAGVQLLNANLSILFPVELPARYGKLRTRAGLARFVADLMHHLIIRHEVYGTSAVRLALDPRISKVQVPRDGGTYAVDEWRSLACIAMATSRVRYTELLTTDWSDLFADLLDPMVRQAYLAALVDLRKELNALQERWGNDRENNYDTQRLAPDELDLGAGY